MIDRPTGRSYCFGPFRLDVSRQQLYKDDRPVELARRLVRTLQLLVENHGKDLEKTYLMDQLWPATVVEENNLTVIISMLRKVLGDDAEHKRYILTNPGRGYRFVAEVIETTPDAPLAHAVQAPDSDPGNPAANDRRFFQRYVSLRWIGPAAGLSLLLAVFSVREWNTLKASEDIAVLPFQSLGAESDDGYLGLGMADGLITRLRNIRHVVVRPIADVAKYQSTAYDPLALGKELNVVSLLDGTVQRTGDQIWLRVKLLRVRDGAILWAHEYHGKFADILTLQDQIAEQATRALALKLDSAEQKSIRRHYTGSSDAYEMYIAARSYCIESVTTKSLEKGISYFLQATARDPQFALAYASLAACYVHLANISDNTPPKDLLAKAEVAAQRALEIDGNLQEAYLPLAMAKTYYDWNFPAAEAAFRKSINLDPEDSATHREYALFLISQGRFPEAEREAQKATELDPFSLSAEIGINSVYFFGHHYDEALSRWEKGWKLQLNEDEAVWYLAWIYASQGRPNPMIDDLLKTEATASRKGIYAAGLAYIYALKGMKPLAESYLQKFSEDPDDVDDYDYQIGLVYVALGDHDNALQYLNRAKQKRSMDFIYVKVDPRLDSLRSDSRFNELVSGVHSNPE